MSYEIKVKSENKIEAKKEVDETVVRINGIARLVGLAKQKIQK